MKLLVQLILRMGPVYHIYYHMYNIYSFVIIKPLLFLPQCFCSAGVFPFHTNSKSNTKVM